MPRKGKGSRYRPPEHPWTILDTHMVQACGHTALVAFVAEDRARVESILKHQARWNRLMADPTSVYYSPTLGCSGCEAQGRVLTFSGDFVLDSQN